MLTDIADRLGRSLTAPSLPHVRMFHAITGGKHWWAATRQCVGEIRSGQLTDEAAGLTYYGLLALFPGLLVMVSIFGLVGGRTNGLDQAIKTVVPGQVGDFLRTTVDQIAASGRAAGLAGVVGLLLAFWSASGYMAAFIRATADPDQSRRLAAKWTLSLRLGMTAAVGLLMIICVLLIVFTGDLAVRAGQAIGVGTAGLTAWNIAKWPVLIVLLAVTLALLYRLPYLGIQRLRWFTVGSLTAMVLWILVSAAFALYLSTLASYQRTYGALSGAIAFLVWLWLTNVVVLIGARLDAGLARQIAADGGAGADKEQTPIARPRRADLSAEIPRSHP